MLNSYLKTFVVLFVMFLLSMWGLSYIGAMITAVSSISTGVGFVLLIVLIVVDIKIIQYLSNDFMEKYKTFHTPKSDTSK